MSCIAPRRVRLAAVASAIAGLSGLMCAAAQQTPSGAAPASAGEVTLTGPYLCLASQLKRGTEHIAVVYAFDGPAQVRAALARVMAEYPEHALDVQGALKLQESLDREVLYYIEPNDVEKATHRESEFWGWPAAVTGTLSERDGKRWIMPTRIEPRAATARAPEPMLRPDKPLVMPDGPPISLSISDALGIKCVPIPAGSFLQGSPFHQWPRCHDEYPHECVLTKDFYLAETPTTQEVFEAVMGQNPTPEARRGPQNPVENALWADIVEFCRRVSERTGHTARLPTGAEFEYAARAGTSDACFPDKYRDQESDIGNKASPAVPVKTKQPNAWGLYDMLTYYGWHACSDYDAENPTGKQVDPQGPIPGKDPIYFPGAHRALGGDQYGVRPNIHYWYFEGPKPEADGHWVGIFRVAVEP